MKNICPKKLLVCYINEVKDKLKHENTIYFILSGNHNYFVWIDNFFKIIFLLIFPYISNCAVLP